MQVTLYLDIIFCINFLADYIVLWMTACIFRERIRKRRICAGAFIGSLLMLLFLFLPRSFPKITEAIGLLGISMGTVFFAFGRRGVVKKWFCSTTIVFLIGSVMNYVRMMTNQTILTFCGWLVLFMGGMGITAFLVRTGRKIVRNGADIYPVELCNAGNHVYCKIFMDTGNFLMDPLFGRPVIMISKNIAKSCLNDAGRCLIESYEKKGVIDYSEILEGNIQQTNCFHEIAFCSVGNPSGKMLCFLVDEFRVGGVSHIHRKQPVAVAPEYLFRDTEYQGLMHRECL